jgi:hypothetical protein
MGAAVEIGYPCLGPVIPIDYCINGFHLFFFLL